MLMLEKETLNLYQMQKMQILLQSNRWSFNDSQIDSFNDSPMWPKSHKNGQKIYTAK